VLTRLTVRGFKNLVEADIRLGPFTCIAGANGAGKSNLFDAIHFVSALASKPILDAALSVRDEKSRTSDVKGLFHHAGGSWDRQMSFEAEMIIPATAMDDLGQKARATFTFVKYKLVLALREDGPRAGNQGPIEIQEEELTYIQKSDFKKRILFAFSSEWRNSVLKGKRGTPFISTAEEKGRRIIQIHQDQKGGRIQRLLAESLPRTVLSSVNAAENPTALCAKREMESWTLLQLEPGALRKPNHFNDPDRMTYSGENLPAALSRLSRSLNPAMVYQSVTNALASLIEDVRSVTVEADTKKELLTIVITSRDGTDYPAQSLSDGTLRFLALIVLSLDPEQKGLICLEEPENGIHPERIPAMLRLLMAIAVDVKEPIGPENPLRQIIINTHSPAVVGQVNDDALIMAENREIIAQGVLMHAAVFAAMKGTWRENDKKTFGIAKGRLLRYLNPIDPSSADSGSSIESRRVIDRVDISQMTLIPALFEDSPKYDSGRSD